MTPNRIEGCHSLTPLTTAGMSLTLLMDADLVFGLGHPE